MPDHNLATSRKGALTLLGLASAAIALNIAMVAALERFFPVAVSVCPGLLLIGVAGLVRPELANFLLVDAGMMKGDKSAFARSTRLIGGGIFVVGCAAGLITALAFMDH